MTDKRFLLGMLALVFITAVFFTACNQRNESGGTGGSSSANAQTKKRLANTTWEGQFMSWNDNSFGATLVFGENGFKLTYSDTTISGTYEINGDEVILRHGADDELYKGVVLDNILTWEVKGGLGLVNRYEFQQVK